MNENKFRCELEIVDGISIHSLYASQHHIIVKWWIKYDNKRQIFLQKDDKVVTLEDTNTKLQYIVKSPIAGTIVSTIDAIKIEFHPDDKIISLKPCEHPALFNSMCVSCGNVVKSIVSTASLSLKSSNGSISVMNDERVTVLSSGAQLQLRQTEAEFCQESKQIGLKASKKLALVLDLDHTLIHACDRKSNVSEDEKKMGIHMISLDESNNLLAPQRYCIKLRPHLSYFLQECNKLCQLSIYTAGTRKYAEAISKILDPETKLFSGRIVSRSDHPITIDNRGFSVEKSLSKILLGDESYAIILDDREDVWKGSQSEQLLLVRPYKYFLDDPEVNNASGMSTTSGNQHSSPSISLNTDPPGIVLSPSSDESIELDDQLLRSLEIIRDIHQSVFQNSPSSIDSKVNVASVLKSKKAKILKGCLLSFLGLVPIDYQHKPEKYFLCQLAISLGAEVSTEIIPSMTTHVICINPQHFSIQSNRLNNNEDMKLWVLHPDWLLYCRWSLKKAYELTFSLFPMKKDLLPKTTLLTDEQIANFKSIKELRSSTHDSSESINKTKSSDNLELNVNLFKKARLSMMPHLNVTIDHNHMMLVNSPSTDSASSDDDRSSTVSADVYDDNVEGIYLEDENENENQTDYDDEEGENGNDDVCVNNRYDDEDSADDKAYENNNDYDEDDDNDDNEDDDDWDIDDALNSSN